MLLRLSLFAMHLLGAVGLGFDASAAARNCNEEERRQLLAPAETEADLFNLTCSVTLTAADRVTKRINIGPEGSGITLNCGGASLAFERDIEKPGNRRRLQLRSSFDASKGVGKKVSGVSITQCKIVGGVDVSINISLERYKQLTRSEDFSRILSSVSPDNINFDGVSIRAPTVGGRPVTINLFYVGPGSNAVSFKNGAIEGGVAGGVPIYLDDSSSNNVVENSVFSVNTDSRELLAIDGSSGNLIAGNKFINLRHGAIFLYRNCGENGVVRRGKPEKNRLFRNLFVTDQSSSSDTPAIWVASRERGPRFKSWCALDAGVPFGSGQDDSDNAKRNQVKFNMFVGFRDANAIRVDDQDNDVAENSFQAGP